MNGVGSSHQERTRLAWSLVVHVSVDVGCNFVRGNGSSHANATALLKLQVVSRKLQRDSPEHQIHTGLRLSDEERRPRARFARAQSFFE